MRTSILAIASVVGLAAATTSTDVVYQVSRALRANHLYIILTPCFADYNRYGHPLRDYPHRYVFSPFQIVSLASRRAHVRCALTFPGKCYPSVQIGVLLSRCVQVTSLSRSLANLMSLDCIGGSLTVLTTFTSTSCETTSTPGPVVTPSYSAPPVVESSASTTASIPSSSSAIEVASSSVQVPSSGPVVVPSSSAEVLSTTITASIQTGSTVVVSLSTVPTENPSYVPSTTSVYSNSSETLLTASGSPSRAITSAITVTTPATNSSPTAQPTPSATQSASAAGNVLVPGLTLVLLGIGTYLFG